MTSKRHHYVPRFHLESFVNPGGFLWVYAKVEGGESTTARRARAPVTGTRRLAAVLLFAGAAGCASDLRPAPAGPAPAVAAPPLIRAIITIEDVQRFIDDEKVFTERADRLPRPGEPWFAVLDGCTEGLVTAPHATKPTRDGRLRFTDSGTGSLSAARAQPTRQLRARVLGSVAAEGGLR